MGDSFVSNLNNITRGMVADMATDKAQSAEGIAKILEAVTHSSNAQGSGNGSDKGSSNP